MSPAFVFLHGGGQGGWVWDETIAALALQTGGAVRCLALDGPGCGARRVQDTTAMTFADVTRALLDDVVAAGFEGAVLVGHSQAGVHMPHMVELAPGLFRKLVFVTCSTPLPGWTITEQMGDDIVHGEDPDRIGWPVAGGTAMAERYRAMFCNDMSAAQTAAFFARMQGDMWPACCYAHRDWRYGHLRGHDTSYVLCERDLSLPVEWQERFARRFHARRVYRLDAGHQAMTTRPQALAEILLAEAAR
ncbi:MAG: alpha/beta hydrolase [Sphingomonadales bacterium]|nr:alpha/beta hydrolase [Sphingomonadales bacterium]